MENEWGMYGQMDRKMDGIGYKSKDFCKAELFSFNSLFPCNVT